MQENYRAPEAGTKLAFELQPGDPVLVREFIPGKNKLKAKGPYTLLQKIRGSGAEVISAKGKTKRVAISNLKPYRPPITGEVRVTTRAQARRTRAQFDSSSSSDFGSTSGEDSGSEQDEGVAL